MTNAPIMAEPGDDAARARAFDLFNLPEGYFEQPYPWFKLLRDHDPLHTQADGSVLLTRYEDVRFVWRDLSGVVDRREMFTKRWGQGPLLEHYTTAMLFRDPPDHDRLRRFVNPLFYPASIERQRQFVEKTVARLIGEVGEKRDIDFLHEYAARIPIAVICNILGIPQADAAMIQELGRRILVPLNAKVSKEIVEQGHEAVRVFTAYMTDFFVEARKRPEVDPELDVVSALIAAERSGGQISFEEMVHMCIMMLNGGHETTTNLIATSMHALLDDPEQMEVLRQEPEIIDTAVEEFIRYVSPLQFQGRRTTKQVETPAGTIGPNVEVMFCQASANRDERIFDNPERLNLRRKMKTPHIAFGAGIHICIGQPLARLEAKIALPAIVKRFKTIERTGTARFNPNPRFRGLEKLPVRLQ